MHEDTRQITMNTRLDDIYLRACVPLASTSSEADMMRITGGGDSREDVDPADAHADFVNGIIDGGELD